MDKLTIEQKAKAYDEALERAKGVIEQNPLMEYLKKGIEYIFPELKESEDERIRKELIEYLRTLPNHFSHNGSLITDWIAWLEKKGVQKPTDKVEPKFKVGDKIRKKTPRSFDKDMQVARICNDHYMCNHIGKFSSEPIPFSEESYYELIERKPTDNVEPKFKIGDLIKYDEDGEVNRVLEITSDGYKLERGSHILCFSSQDHWKLVEDSVSEDEKIRKELKSLFLGWINGSNPPLFAEECNRWIAWLEKQSKETSWKPSKEEMDALYGLAYITNKMDDKKDEAITKLYQDLKREFFSGVSYENMFPSSPVDSPKLEKQCEQKSIDNLTPLEAMNIAIAKCFDEQKPDDKVEPKFKVGDYVVGKYISGYISEVRDDCYLLDYQGFSINKQDNYHLWTIRDAKDGDVLHCWIDGDEFILIYKGIKDGYITTYGHLYQKFKSFSEEPTAMFCRTIQGHFTPATKEQRDLLFQKIKEAGYEWDGKELKKVEQDPAWSEEDEKMLDEIIDFFKNGTVKLQHDLSLYASWLKAIKDRVQPQNRWKPSDEQIIALKQAKADACGKPYFNALCSLYIKLKGLKL